MKAGVLSKSYLHNAAGEFCGLNLGYEFAAEHEIGIVAIKAAFGVNGYAKDRKRGPFGLFTKSGEKLYGAQSRKISKLPNMAVVSDDKEFVSFGYLDSLSSIWMKTLHEDGAHAIKNKKFKFASWWSDRGFFVTMPRGNEINDLLLAFGQHDIIIGSIDFGKENFLSTGGLGLGILSRMDQSTLDKLEENDRKQTLTKK